MALEQLKNLLKDDVMVSLIPSYGKKICILVEEDSDYKLEIKGINDDVIVVKSDAFEAPLSFFKNDKGACKRADYLIISEEKKKIAIIELKRTKDSSSNADIILQLKGARCILDYISAVLENFYDSPEVFKDYKVLYFKGYSKVQNRALAHVKNVDNNHSPETAAIIPGTTIHYNRLLG